MIKLMPKEYTGQGPLVPEGFKLPVSQRMSMNLLLGLAVIFLLLSLVSYLVLFFANQSLNQERASLETEVKSLEQARDLDLETQVSQLQKRIKIFQNLLEGHLYPSRLFTLIEELTIPQVQFNSFNADLENHKLNLEGRTASYSFLAKQLTVLEQDERIKEVEASNIALRSEAGGVGFNLLLEFDPAILKESNK